MPDMTLYPLPAKAHRRALLKAERHGWSQRKMAKFYGVNPKYICEYLRSGKKPANLEVCYKMGLKLRPMLGPKPPPHRYLPAIRKMAAETRKVTRGWKVRP